MRTGKLLTLTLTALTLLARSEAAAQPPTLTTITVEDLHCAGCARRVLKQVGAVEGVATAKADVKEARVDVTPRPERAPSPRALWEAVEKAGFKPVKLVGPAGTFTARPTS